jgi:3-oxoacyl-[acyl-carrier-protein] synthase-1
MNAVITGRGLITPLGNGLLENERALEEGRTGTVFMPEWKEANLESHVAGRSDNNPECPLIDKKIARFTTPGGKMAVAAAYEAVMEAGFGIDGLRGKKVAVVLGNGGSTFIHVHEGGVILKNTGKVKRVTPFIVPRSMNSSATANISLSLGLTGETYSISSACASGSHAIMLATRLIRDGLYDIVITGGSEEANWLNALGFDAMKALSRKYNATPERASRPFDKERDGFVLAEGAGILVLESNEHAEGRGARQIARVSGIAANSNATDMVVPDSDSARDVMAEAIADAGLASRDIDYINTHGTATPVGDPVEMRAVKELLGDHAGNAFVNSTKSQTGHMIGATGAVETIFCTQMLDKGFVSPTANLENPEDELSWANLPTERVSAPEMRHALNNSFGFGGTNVALVVSKP